MDKQEATRVHAVLQDQEMKSIDDRATEYLDMFRDEQYLKLSECLKKETPQCIVAFCRLVCKYENVGHLTFIRELLGDEG